MNKYLRDKAEALSKLGGGNTVNLYCTIQKGRSNWGITWSAHMGRFNSEPGPHETPEEALEELERRIKGAAAA